MSKDKISDYSATANSNTDIGGINIDEGCAPSGINDAIRTLMKQLKDFQQGTQSDVFKGPLQVGAASSIEVTDNSNAALRITQLGTGNALLVEDSSNPDSTPFVIDANGNTVVGASTATIEKFEVWGTGSAFTRNTDNATNFHLYLQKSRGSQTSPTIVQSGDTIANIRYKGYDGAAYLDAATISAAVDGTPGTNDMPGRLVFSTTADGASTPTERMRIDSSGNVGIGTISPATQLVLSASNNGIVAGTAPNNTLRFSDADISTASGQPLGRVEFYTNDTGNEYVASYIESRAAGSSGGGYFVIGTSASGGGVPAADVLTISPTGGITIERTAVTSPVSNDGNVFSGTYTPTLTNGTNVAASTAYECQYMRVGNVVTVSGQIAIDPTSASTNTDIGVSLPIASNFGAARQCSGVGASQDSGTYGQSFSIRADATNDRAQFLLTPTSTSNVAYAFTMTYRVI